MSTTERPATNITVGLVRFSYAWVFDPYTGPDGKQAPKFQVTLLLPKSDEKQVEAVKKAIEAAKQKGKESKWGGSIPKKLDIQFRDGDESEDESHEGHYTITAKNSNKPMVVDKDKQPILDKTEFYSGCYGYANIDFFPYNTNSNGIGAALNIVAKTKDGDALGGKRVTVDEAFEGIELVAEEDDL